MNLAVLGDFLVRKAIGNLGCALIMAEKGHIRQNCLDVGFKTAYRQRDTTALAPSNHSNTLRINGGMRSGCFDSTHSVGEDTAIIIGLRIENAASHEAGYLRIGAIWFAIGRITTTPGPARAARIHDQISKACATP